MVRCQLWGIASSVVVVVLAATAPAEPPAPARRGTWPIAAMQKSASFEVFVPKPGGRPPEGSGALRPPAVVYLKNLAVARAGTEPDASILEDLLHDGFVVLTIDLEKHPRAVAPYLNADLRLLRRDIGRLFSAEAIDEDHVYFLPEGDRLKRDVIYYGRGAEAYRLDLRYPSRPRVPSPVLMQIPVSNENRMSNGAGHYYYNDLIAEGALTRGYAVAQVDPPLKTYTGVDPMPEVAWRLKAAVRTIRSQAALCGLSDRIGVMGFSRSSGQAAILAMSGGNQQLEGDGPHREFSSRVQAAVLHSGRMDHELLVNSGDPIGKIYINAWGQPVSKVKLDAARAQLLKNEPLPDGRKLNPVDRQVLRQVAKAKVDQMQRTFDRWQAQSAVNYVTAEGPPTFLCVGAKDDHRPEQIQRMADALKRCGVPFEQVVVPEMGHEVVGDVAVLDRIYRFLDKNLRPPARQVPGWK